MPTCVDLVRLNREAFKVHRRAAKARPLVRDFNNANLMPFRLVVPNLESAKMSYYVSTGLLRVWCNFSALSPVASLKVYDIDSILVELLNTDKAGL